MKVLFERMNNYVVIIMACAIALKDKDLVAFLLSSFLTSINC